MAPFLQILSPADLTVLGKSGKNIFLAQTERFVTITWVPFDSSEVVAYNVLRDTKLIANITAASMITKFVDHNRKKNRTYNYTVDAVNGNNQVLAKDCVTVKTK